LGGYLAGRLHTDVMNARRLADHPQRAGLVSPVPDPGHRQRRVLALTGSGAAVAGELGRRSAAYQRRLARLIGPAEITRLQGLLDHLEAVLSADRRSASVPGAAEGELWKKKGSR